MLARKKIAVLGAGHIGQALIGGLLQAKLIGANRITATRRKSKSLGELKKKWGVRTASDNRKAIAGADIIILAVKPQGAPAVLDEINADVQAGQLIISVMAGLTTQTINEGLNNNCPVIRAMPNTPAVVDEGATALAKGAHASDKHLKLAESIFKAVGIVDVVPERLMDAVTGLSGSGPVYVYMVIEALIDAGVKVGLPRATARRLAIQTVYGSAKLVLESGKHPAVLRDEVTTPAGTAIEAIHTLESKGLRTDLIDAVVAATRRSKELRRPIDD
jgi:pyrroline-5-carboxylate reductase